MDAQQIASKLLEFFYTPDRWTQGAYARRASGLKVTPNDVHAVSFDTLGALKRIYHVYADSNPYSKALAKALNQKVANLSTWHDSQESFETYIRALRDIRGSGASEVVASAA